MYTTSKFVENLINAVISYMKENKVDVFPLNFLVNRNDYASCENARNFYEHGWRYFTVNENNELILHGVWDHLGKEFIGEKFEWIVVSKWFKFEPKTIHYAIHSADAVALVQIAYDTIGSSYFKGRGVESYDLSEIEELEAEYEARRNEVA